MSVDDMIPTTMGVSRQIGDEQPHGEVYSLVQRSLTEANPGYRDVDEIVRLFASGAPIHIAAHWIEGAEDQSTRDYSCAHVHDDLDEVNVLLGDPGGLVCNILLGANEEPACVEAPSAVVIPAGVTHSANVVKGRGWFVALRLPAGSLKPYPGIVL